MQPQGSYCNIFEFKSMLIKTKQKCAISKRSLSWHSILGMRISLQEPHFSSVDLFWIWVCQSPMFWWPSRSIWCLVSSEKGWKKGMFSHEKSGILTVQLHRTLFFSLTICSQMFSALGLWVEHTMTGFEGRPSMVAGSARHRLAFACFFFLSFFLISKQCYHCNLQWNSKPNLSLLKGVEN